MGMKQFCLAGLSAFVLLTVASAPLSAQQNNAYDPWLDLNEDGQLNITDLATIAQGYGASGDPTRNMRAQKKEFFFPASFLQLSMGPWKIIPQIIIHKTVKQLGPV